MTCDEAIDTLTAAFEPGPQAEPPPGVAAHLAGCAACRAEADALRALVGRMQAELSPRDDVAPPPFAAVEAALARRPAPPSRAAGLALRVAAGLGVAVLGALVDRAWVRDAAAPPAPPAADAPIAPAMPSPPADRPTREDRAREALASNPGGLVAALAALDALSARDGR